MISALPPGKLAFTEIVGKSTCGNGDTGSTVNAIAPAIAIATVSSVVATGRWINGAERFMTSPQPLAGLHVVSSSSLKTAPQDYRRRYRSPASYTTSGPGSKATRQPSQCPA